MGFRSIWVEIAQSLVVNFVVFRREVELQSPLGISKGEIPPNEEKKNWNNFIRQYPVFIHDRKRISILFSAFNNPMYLLV